MEGLSFLCPAPVRNKSDNFFGNNKAAACLATKKRRQTEIRLLDEVGLSLAIGLVTSCCGRQTACWSPACCWMGWGSMSIGDPSESHKGRISGDYKKMLKACCKFCTVGCNNKKLLIRQKRLKRAARWWIKQFCKVILSAHVVLVALAILTHSPCFFKTSIDHGVLSVVDDVFS